MSSKHSVMRMTKEETVTFREQRLQALKAFQEAWWEQRCQEWRERGCLGTPGRVISRYRSNETP
ncbi:Uncharacterised protein [Serratia quinivorans]|nr:Uncharacterised protein [Serratia quinivorans]CAI0930166.1 Uncharacterised protein [Serratia quinivorans]CAI0947441.1 Uncharacterised protein [Serratia quinivorans]CAI1147579.1 Uncharacterised protein [Serratia quinivorans]CAI1736532.1 Uncharacterised protein [Serratia quinivorans]